MEQSPDNEFNTAAASATHEEAVNRILRDYRERRQRRRGVDTFFGSPELLVSIIEGEEARTEREQRRSEIMKEAEEVGMPSDLAEKLYDIAYDEGLDPHIAFELVCTGFGVLPPEGGITNASEVPTSDKYLPTWVFPAEQPDDLLRERTLRLSFRRLRHFLEENENVEEAFARYAQEPDVGFTGY